MSYAIQLTSNPSQLKFPLSDPSYCTLQLHLITKKVTGNSPLAFDGVQGLIATEIVRVRGKSVNDRAFFAM